MKILIAAVVLMQMSSCLAFSQAAQKAGGWSIYTADSTGFSGKTLIQSTSKEQYTNDQGQLVGAQMDAICVKNKLVAVALNINSIVPKHSVNQSGAVDTTLVSYEVAGQGAKSESWAVLDHGSTLVPYAQIRQERRTREWMYRIANSDTLVLQFSGSDTAHTVKATFETAGFAQALSAAGCSY